MECVATARLLVVQVALPLASATAAQPAIELPPSVKLTLPVGLDPATVAVKVTLLPNVDGLSELTSVVALATLLTTCARVALAGGVVGVATIIGDDGVRRDGEARRGTGCLAAR